MDNLLYHAVPLCKLNQTERRACVDDVNENVKPGHECDCPNECRSKSYDVKITQLEWPTNRSIARFVASVYKDLNGSAIDYIIAAIGKYSQDQTQYTQSALNQLRSTFGSVIVYFRDLSETVIVERPVYNFVLIISNFGGLLGLYLGISVLTILELVDFGFDLMEYMRIRGKKQSYHKYMNEKMFVSDTQPLFSRSTSSCTSTSHLSMSSVSAAGWEEYLVWEQTVNWINFND